MAKSPLYALDGSQRFARDDELFLVIAMSIATKQPIVRILRNDSGCAAALPEHSRRAEPWIASSLRSSQSNLASSALMAIMG
jgi:hypothetical protein